jgi:hypothetical protein
MSSAYLIVLHHHWPLPAVRDLTRDGRWSTYDVSVLKLSNVSFRGKCAHMGNTLKKNLSSPTKLARLGHFHPASQAGRLAGPVFYICLFSGAKTFSLFPHSPSILFGLGQHTRQLDYEYAAGDSNSCPHHALPTFPSSANIGRNIFLSFVKPSDINYLFFMSRGSKVCTCMTTIIMHCLYQIQSLELWERWERCCDDQITTSIITQDFPTTLLAAFTTKSILSIIIA